MIVLAAAACCPAAEVYLLDMDPSSHCVSCQSFVRLVVQLPKSLESLEESQSHLASISISASSFCSESSFNYEGQSCKITKVKACHRDCAAAHFCIFDLEAGLIDAAKHS